MSSFVKWTCHDHASKAHANAAGFARMFAHADDAEMRAMVQSQSDCCVRLDHVGHYEMPLLCRHGDACDPDA